MDGDGLASPGEVRAHLERIYGASLDAGLRVLVCSKKNFAGSWHESIDSAAAAAMALAGETDVYVGIGTRRTPPKDTKKRGLAEEIDSIPGLWADIDFGTEGHEKKNLPKTFDEAKAFVLALFPMHAPTMVLFSGHGLQAYWLFPEPWIFESAEERRKAAALSVRFSATVKAFAKVKGYGIDSVFDLSRVFRLAGTVNRKTTPVPVRVDSWNSTRRYEADELEGLLVAEEFIPDAAGRVKAHASIGFLELSPGREPPTDALVALLTNHEKARATWEGKRPDMADQSPSSLDFSLAVIAARCGWTDQEIADLLIARRRRAGQDLKTTKRGAIRLDYYQRTLANARKRVEDEKGEAEVEESDADPLINSEGKPIDDKAREKIFKRVRWVFGIPIVRFVQRGDGDEALFSFILGDETQVPLGTASALDNQGTMRSKVYPIAHRFPKRLKAATWDRIMAELGSVVEVIENPEATREGQFASLLVEYLIAKRSLSRQEDWTAALTMGEPFVRDGQLFVCTTNIEAWARTSYTRKVDSRSLWIDLPAWGFQTTTENARVAGRKIVRRYWRIPIDDLTSRGEDVFIPIVFGSGPASEKAPGGSAGSARNGGSATTPATGSTGSPALGGSSGSSEGSGRGKTSPRPVSGQTGKEVGSDGPG